MTLKEDEDNVNTFLAWIIVIGLFLSFLIAVSLITCILAAAYRIAFG